jgi:hypothetical protein
MEERTIKGHKILIIDSDEEAVLHMMAPLIDHIGVDIIVVASPETAKDPRFNTTLEQAIQPKEKMTVELTPLPRFEPPTLPSQRIVDNYRDVIPNKYMPKHMRKR